MADPASSARLFLLRDVGHPDSGFSHRVFRILKGLGIRTGRELVRKSKVELLSNIGVGRRTLGEIDVVLNSHGLTLHMKEDVIKKILDAKPQP